MVFALSIQKQQGPNLIVPAANYTLEMGQ